MARLRFAILLGLALAAPARAAPVGAWQPFIDEAAGRFGLPPQWIARVLEAESHGQEEALSQRGAMGLMQIMPATWSEMRAALGLGTDPFEPHDNILAGAFYLKRLYARFGYPGLFAAYNAGPARYADLLAGRRGLPRETLSYVAALTREAPPPTSSNDPAKGMAAAAPPSGAAIFFQLSQAPAGQ